MTLPICYRVFSGLQPTGVPHIGNYFGALSQWLKLANKRKLRINNKHFDCDKPIYSIVDVHAYCSPSTHFGEQLYNNILSTTASLLAIGLNQNNCILFRQSDVLEHNYLDNVFDIFTTPSQLTRLPQFKEKTKNLKLVTNGLLNYPVLQAADILLYRANIVPVGEDQIHHIELTRDIAKKFNSLTETELFPIPEPFLADSLHSRRIKSLRNPDSKMSKSEANKKSFINIIDEPDVIVEKCKKAITDSISAVYYDAENRHGVSNLMRIYHLATNSSLEEITDEFKGIETAEFKLRLADCLIEKFKNVRLEYKRLQCDRSYLEDILKLGAKEASPIAKDTISQVKFLLGSYRPQLNKIH